ncbi:hypothetical protein EYF80_056351 [Liparis tanakae]|uniref:Uncharacterized protein n=1 Tax=Liparis tanakae TaxID=230148 RepID=A0A4Z2EX39_9TELE|nr:hypothetical protein EYF80_056351 [Liparis tanakae]
MEASAEKGGRRSDGVELPRTEREGDLELFANMLSSFSRGPEAQQGDRLRETMREDPWKPQSRSALQTVREDLTAPSEQLRLSRRFLRMNTSPPDGTEEVQEEADYVNEAARRVEPVAAAPAIALCWLLPLLILGLRLHCESLEEQLLSAGRG